jgi:isopentenyl-diphosphate delta-isomerase
MEKSEAHMKGALHRAISVFITTSDQNWLLQRRAADKYHSGGLLTNTCCSHPFPGESNTAAASRRLQEEMGMQCHVKELFHFVYREELDNNMTEHELDHVFWGVSDDLPVINQAEVEEYLYISFPDLEADINRNPEKYTVWFRKIYKQVQEHIVEQVNEPI